MILYIYQLKILFEIISAFSLSLNFSIAITTFNNCSVCSPFKYRNSISFRYSNSVSSRLRSLHSELTERRPTLSKWSESVVFRVEWWSRRSSSSRSSFCRSRLFSDITRFISSRFCCSVDSWRGRERGLYQGEREREREGGYVRERGGGVEEE